MQTNQPQQTSAGIRLVTGRTTDHCVRLYERSTLDRDLNGLRFTSRRPQRGRGERKGKSTW